MNHRPVNGVVPSEPIPVLLRRDRNDFGWNVFDKKNGDAGRFLVIVRINHRAPDDDADFIRAEQFPLNTLMVAPWLKRMLVSAIGIDAVKGLILKLRSSDRRERIEAEKRLGQTPEPEPKYKKEQNEIDAFVEALTPAYNYGFLTSIIADAVWLEQEAIKVVAPAVLMAQKGWHNLSVAFVPVFKKAVDRMGLRRNNLRADNAVAGLSTGLKTIAAPHPAEVLVS